MTGCPATIGGAKTICYARLGAAAPASRTDHTVTGAQAAASSILVVAQDPNDDQYYLFGCDASYAAQTDTCHATIEDALAQASFEYPELTLEWVQC